jgi:hypothetical protein
VQKTHGRRLADTLKDETICNIQDTELLDVGVTSFHTCGGPANSAERNFALRGPGDPG